MKEEIIIMLNPVSLQQIIYVMSGNSETIPIIKECTQEELLPTILNFSEKYQINDIKLKGSKDYSQGIKEQLQTKAKIYFNKENKLNIELI